MCREAPGALQQWEKRRQQCAVQAPKEAATFVYIGGDEPPPLR